MQKGAWADLAVVGAEFALRVTPRARREEITCDEGGIRAKLRTKGLKRAAEFTWQRTAELTRASYEQAMK